MRKNGVDRASEHARILVPKKKKKSLGVKRAMGLKKDKPDPRAGRPPAKSPVDVEWSKQVAEAMEVQEQERSSRTASGGGGSAAAAAALGPPALFCPREY